MTDKDRNVNSREPLADSNSGCDSYIDGPSEGNAIELTAPTPEELLEQVPPDVPRSELARRLEPVLAALADHGPIRTDVVLDAITSKLGVRRRALLERLKQLRMRSDECDDQSEAAGERPCGPAAPGAAAVQVPQIQVAQRRHSELVDEAHGAIARANERRIAAAAAGPVDAAYAPLFVHDGAVVRLDGTPGQLPRLVPLTKAWMRGVLLREAHWVRSTKRGVQPVFPPNDLAGDLVASPPSSLPIVDTVTSTPVFDANGALLLAPGLHRDERLWLAANPALVVGDIPERPNREQVARARGLYFDELFAGFPFVGPSDRAHALGAVLLPFVRRMIDGCTPLHVVDAPVAGAGKNLLCNVISLVATGARTVGATLPDSDTKLGRLVTTELSARPSVILLEAAAQRQMLAAPPLVSIATSVSWTGSVTGKARMVKVPNRALWIVTGTNLRLSKELARCATRIRLDPEQDRSWMASRRKNDPVLDWMAVHRSELVHAALVLVRAWLAAGRPKIPVPPGPFEPWAATIGGILAIASIEGFVGNLDAR